MSPRATAFLAFLGRLFAEAAIKERTTNADEFACVRPELVKFIVESGRTSSVRARCDCFLKFSDGETPVNRVQLPPGKVKIDDYTRVRLDTATSGREFIEIVRVAMEKKEEALGRGIRLILHPSKKSSTTQNAAQSPSAVLPGRCRCRRLRLNPSKKSTAAPPRRRRIILHPSKKVAPPSTPTTSHSSAASTTGSLDTRGSLLGLGPDTDIAQLLIKSLERELTACGIPFDA
ncbi:hypothetical protein AK830_g9928 [Neonectria ditissima]|uniref:Uncharacterized protein n=1 Tax=Neonectria ditissima TaxID=78410 RepID=A0A0P7AGV7_9HYPO|nr:hypothetical protein AK830_g9928 [Neonectria ditissima]